MFDKMHRENDHDIQEAVNGLEQQEKDLDEKISHMRQQIQHLTAQNMRLEERLKTEETQLDDFEKMEAQ